MSYCGIGKVDFAACNPDQSISGWLVGQTMGVPAAKRLGRDEVVA